MNRIDKWLLNRIARKAVIQGHHRYEMELFFEAIVDAARNEFTEDNKATLDSFIHDRFQVAIEKPT